MSSNFVDFWSKNRWLCQYQTFNDGGETYVWDAIVVDPLSKPPYHNTDRFRWWTLERMHQWMETLDSHTTMYCFIGQVTPHGNLYPKIRILMFPCPNGEWYAAYPVDEPKYYVRSHTFSPHPSWRDPGYEDRMHQDWLERGQEILSSTARRLWARVVREDCGSY